MEDDKDDQKPVADKLEEFAIRVLNSFLERKTTRQFWIQTTVAMIVVTAGPAVLISAFLLVQHFGVFD